MLYTLKLVGLNADEIEFLALTMELKRIGMGDASKYIDNMPSVLFENIDGETAKKYKAMYEEVGAVIEVVHSGDKGGGGSNNIARPSQNVGNGPISIEMPTPIFSQKKLEDDTYNREPLPKPTAVEIPPAGKEPMVQVDLPENNPQSVFQFNRNAAPAEPAKQETEEEGPKYDFYGSCPRCGSTFVTVKKTSGIFGTKIKCVCSACKHKF